jgi:hypothetical protein
VFFRRYRKWLIWVPGMILLLAIAVFSYGYIKKIPQIYGIIYPNTLLGEETDDPYTGSNTDKTDKLVVETNKTLLEATMKLERYYIKCGHTLDEEHPLESRYIGKTEDELGALFPKWQIKRFTPEQVVLRMELDAYCPDHYLIKEEDGYLVIFRSDKDTGIPLIVEAMEISLEQLSQETIEEMKEGIVVDSIEGVEQVLENWGS